MKRFLAFVLMSAVGVFAIGCDTHKGTTENKTETKTSETKDGKTTTTTDTKTTTITPAGGGMTTEKTTEKTTQTTK